MVNYNLSLGSWSEIKKVEPNYESCISYNGFTHDDEITIEGLNYSPGSQPILRPIKSEPNNANETNIQSECGDIEMEDGELLVS